MTVSMRVMSAGDGYKYLLRTVAANDGDRSMSTPLTRYDNVDGTPPGPEALLVENRPISGQRIAWADRLRTLCTQLIE